MKIENNIYDKSILDLESQFAKDFKSPIFLILANRYHINREYDKCIRVCKIGLKNDPENIMAKYVLSKSYLCINKPFKAEKLLEEILHFNPNSLKPLKLLIEIQVSLNRKQSQIQKNIINLLKIEPDNANYHSLFIGKIDDIKVIKKSIKVSKKHFEFEIDDNMATFAFYDVVKSQKNYFLANKILEKIEKNNGLSSKIKEEKRVILSLLQKDH